MNPANTRQSAKNVSQNGTAEARTQPRSQQTTTGAGNAKILEQMAVDLVPQVPEANARGYQMRDRHRDHGLLCSHAQGQQWREHAADAETGERSNRATQNRCNKKQSSGHFVGGIDGVNWLIS